jgi:hypothetical protein
MSDLQDERFEGEDEQEDVEAHKKKFLGHDDGSDDDSSDDFEAHKKKTI